MKIKYYLRGLGVGIVITTLILLIVFNTTGKNISDEEIISRAKELGMVMAEKEEEPVSGKLNETFGKDKQEVSNPTPAAVTSDSALETSKDDEKVEPVVDDSNDDENTETAEDDSKVDTPAAVTEIKSDDEHSQSVSDGTTNSVTPNGRKASINIVKGDSSRIVSEKIQAAGIVGDAEDFNKFMKNGGYADKIKVGRVTISIGETYKNIAKILTEK